MLGFDVFWAAVVVAVVCAVYVTAGGQTSVIMTDLAQGVIRLVAGLLLFVLGLNALGGWENFLSGLPASHKFPFVKFNEPHQFHFSGIFWQDGVANNIALYMGEFLAGAYVHNGTRLYVNRGIGCLVMPFRFGMRPEVTLHLFPGPAR